jgi:hypothetical protein
LSLAFRRHLVKHASMSGIPIKVGLVAAPRAASAFLVF